MSKEKLFSARCAGKNKLDVTLSAFTHIQLMKKIIELNDDGYCIFKVRYGVNPPGYDEIERN